MNFVCQQRLRTFRSDRLNGEESSLLLFLVVVVVVVVNAAAAGEGSGSCGDDEQQDGAHARWLCPPTEGMIDFTMLEMLL
mmetsp:Transcript_43819/g.106256  ORF Transcript_43819/g.106256 Transcript_43819/m.106256 type:complete len:80 (-) Transcript_43819:66-305(-)